MKEAEGGALRSSVFLRQMKEKECGKELWRGRGYKGKRKSRRERDVIEAEEGLQEQRVLKRVKVRKVR